MVMTGAMAIGVTCGLAAAVLQSISYIASRHFTGSRDAHASFSLLVLMHLWMGVMAAVTLALVWMPGVPWTRVAWPLIFAAFFNVTGQIGLTLALRLAEPSRVSPLLTMKVFFPALLSTILGAPVGRLAQRYLTLWQWLAIALCVAAGVSISRGGGGMKKAALGAIAFGITVFAGSDWCVGLTVGDLLKAPGITPLRASLLAVSALYLLTLIAGLAALPTRWGGSTPGRMTYPWADWRDALPYAASWYLAMIVLFVAFGEIGLVLGTILQCTRSFITILIGAALMYIGYSHIEPKQPHRVILTRIAAGVLMFLAITLYIVRDPVAMLSHWF